MTRAQAVNESPAWLMMLSEAASQESSLSAVRMVDAVLAGTAPGNQGLKDGEKVHKSIRRAFLNAAGL